MGVSKLPRLELSWLCEVTTSCVDLQLQWGLNQSYIPRQELSNGMSHATCTQENLVDSRLLVVRNQTANLTFSPSFGHNLCLKCPNGSCEPILDIYVSITFQWYNELFNAMGFDSYNRTLKIWENSPNRNSFGNVKVYSLTLLHSRTSLLACNLATPCLGREPKAKVTTQVCFKSM
jgi:hypothetical protein